MFTGILRDKNNGRHDPHNFRPLCDNAAMSTNHASHLISDPNLNPNRNPNLSPSPEFAPNFKLVIRILAFDISAHPNLCLSAFIRGLNSCRQGCSSNCQPNRGNNLKMPKMPKSVQLGPEPAAAKGPPITQGFGGVACQITSFMASTKKRSPVPSAAIPVGWKEMLNAEC
jgi:hypothetical protein